MTENEASSRRSGGMTVDGELVRELAELLGETGLSEIEVEDGDRRIRVARNLAAPTLVASAPLTAAAPAPPPIAPPIAPQPERAESGDVEGAIPSPMVGTVYLASEPGAPPFVSVGDQVREGDTLLIVEAMKVMNPITAPRSGTIARVLVENAQPVEFGQPLVVLT